MKCMSKRALENKAELERQRKQSEFDAWWNSLSEEEQKQYADDKKVKHEKAMKELQDHVKLINAINNSLVSPYRY